MKTGDELMVAPPVNDFGLPQRATDFLFIAGGIGITPMMAMIREVQAQGKRFRLFYCTRSPETTAFTQELSAPEFAGSVVIHHDQGDPTCSLDLKPILAERRNREHLYCCGPRPLMEAVRKMTDHWSPTAVHFEAFSEAETHKAGRQAVPRAAGAHRQGARGAGDQDHPGSAARERAGGAEFVRDRHLRHLPHQDAGRRADHRDLVLAEHERADTIMICVSRARRATRSHASHQ